MENGKCVNIFSFLFKVVIRVFSGNRVLYFNIPKLFTVIFLIPDGIVFIRETRLRTIVVYIIHICYDLLLNALSNTKPTSFVLVHVLLIFIRRTMLGLSFDDTRSPLLWTLTFFDLVDITDKNSSAIHLTSFNGSLSVSEIGFSNQPRFAFLLLYRPYRYRVIFGYQQFFFLVNQRRRRPTVLVDRQ